MDHAAFSARIASIPARRCDECGGLTFFAAGGRLGCRECEPDAAADPDAAWFDATPLGGRLRHVPVDRSRLDPPAAAATGSLFVSPTLEYFRAGLSPLTAAEVESGGEVYRRLDRPYFEWLVGMLGQAIESEKVGGTDALDAWQRLAEIGAAAVARRTLGPWAADPDLWPTAPPTNYRPPRPAPPIVWGNAGPTEPIGHHRCASWADVPREHWPSSRPAEPKPPDPGLIRRLLFVPCPGVLGEHHLAYLSPCRRAAYTACRMILFLEPGRIEAVFGEPRGSSACPACTSWSPKWFDRHFAGRRIPFRRSVRLAASGSEAKDFPEGALVEPAGPVKSLL